MTFRRVIPIFAAVVSVSAVVALLLAYRGDADGLGGFLERSGAGVAPGRLNRSSAAAGLALVDRYCTECHSRAEASGGLVLEGRDPGDAPGHAEIWEAVIEKLDAELMPPAGEPRPERAELAAFATFLEASIDAAARANPSPGAPVLHRLNRAEYANAVRDLLDLPIDAANLLPADDSSEGFDNIANALSVSPAHMQAYVSAASKISRLAVGDPTASPSLSTYSPPRGFSQADHVEGLPLGTRGGLIIEHVFPLDAQYEFTIRRAGGGFGLQTVGGDEEVEVTLNGERVRLIGSRDQGSFRLSISAGPQTIGVALVQRRRPVGVDDLYSELADSAGIGSVTIMGPFDTTGLGDTPSRRRIFTCRPADASEERGCALEILATFTRRAFRRPVDDEVTLETLMDFYATGRELGGFDIGIQYALARILVDPRFIFRFEREPESLPAGAVYALGDYELASRLSFFLWSSIPDDELLDAAAAGRLTDDEELRSQVQRMLADPRAEALVENFASQWLGLRALETVNPTAREFDGNLRAAFRRETELLFASILEQDRSVLDLLDADYTFVDERLARHYGISNVRGSRFRRVDVTDDARRGLLGHGSILTATSAPNRTSPVTRGAWILENVLGTPPPAPPPGVETNLDQTTDEGLPLRQRLERHRDDASCAACHNIIDPIGFALENFDAIGRWREDDGGEPVDASGELWDGTALDGPASLRSALLARPERFASAVTERLLTYALGRPVGHDDMPAVRAIVAEAAPGGYRLSDLIGGIVRSVPFQLRVKLPEPDGE